MVEKKPVVKPAKRKSSIGVWGWLCLIVFGSLICLAAVVVTFRMWDLMDQLAYYRRAEMQQKAEDRNRIAQKQAELEQIRIAAEQARQAKIADAVAFVNGEPITMTEIREMVADMPQLAELPFEKIYPNLIDMQINNRVVMQGAHAAGVADRPAIKKALRMAEEQIVGQTYLDELLADKVTEEEIQALYDEEVKNFRREEEIHARHILVKTEKEAKDLLVQLKAGADFAELADKKSLDENTSGGDLGYFTKGMMIPEFGDIVFDMKKGQLSNPIKTPFGWHVVLIEDKRLANPPSLEETRDDIKKAIMETKLPAILATERTKMNVEIVKPTLE
ncbi:MAG: peptidylprolyl isomerase [Alphaproteobacteria bacterium]|nr:peptidylprolyl isomerase [Alphaproteobacteria bacterium]